MSSPATSSPPGNPTAPSDLAWRVIGLVNLYRLLVAAGLLVLTRFPGPRATFGTTHATELLVICAAYFIAGITLVLLRRNFWPGLRALAVTHVAVDALAIGAILWASGGVSSGLGILLVLPIGAMALLAENLDAFFMAAIAALALLLQQVALQLSGEAATNDYLLAGVLGTVLFLVALSVRPLANRLRESEALVRRQEVDLANMAQLSQYIVQHLRESILVVDAEDRIRLINESAAAILGEVLAVPGALLGEVSPRLLYLLSTWRQSSAVNPAGEGTLTAADGARLIQPHFASLSSGISGPVLVFLEDTSLLAEKVQQSKLAALGRLSASIAHEIRNPVGAMSHASQLLAESQSISAADRRLTEIIHSNGNRVSRIVENVLEFSRRGTSKPARLDLVSWLASFCEEFCATLQLAPQRLQIPLAGDGTPADSLEVRVDPQQLQQVLWNLCQNAVTHGNLDGGNNRVELRYGRLASTGRPFLEVADRGPGIGAEDGERIFEPFFTKSQQGTGLGLFLARELALTNGAALLYEARSGGGSVFRVVFSDPGRWEG
jgi:two-component system sensor histidine kinase PilS (NtrC family)